MWGFETDAILARNFALHLNQQLGDLSDDLHVAMGYLGGVTYVQILEYCT